MVEIYETAIVVCAHCHDFSVTILTHPYFLLPDFGSAHQKPSCLKNNLI